MLDNHSTVVASFLARRTEARSLRRCSSAAAGVEPGAGAAQAMSCSALPARLPADAISARRCCPLLQ